MRTVLTVTLVGAVVMLAGGAIAAEPVGVVTFDAQRAHVYSNRGTPLLAGKQGTSAAALAKTFLRQQGVSAATVDSLRQVAAHSAYGVTHVRLQQDVGGLRVAGAYVQAAVNARGELVHLIENVADPSGGIVAGGTVPPEAALDAALAHVHPGLTDRPAVVARSATKTRFAKTPFFHTAPVAERVLLARTDGLLQEGYVVQTWSEEGNLLHETQVLGNGRVGATELRTANDSYNVFAEDPLKGAQTVVAGPGDWLSAGAQRTTNIVGNNANTYLDTDANNNADPGGTAITDGNFLTAVDLGQPPSTASNRAVAVQNLFYLNNVVHDLLYSQGFTESAGNFQEDNFGNGGLGGDSVNAEAQDGSGTDNANFATPSDGVHPRMQMYLWTTAAPTNEVVVGGTSFGAHGAAFGKPLTTSGVTATIRLVDDGVAPTTDGCERLPSRSMRNAIAFVDRGTCTFTMKVKNAQAAGAVGVIVGNNVTGNTFTMGGTEKSIKTPSVMVSLDDRNALVAQLPAAGTMRLLAVQPPQIDGDLDSDIVFHEYGHGLTWRLIGGMDGPLAGAIGEGASDGVAMLINGDDRIGEYAFSNPIGVRSAPYAGYTRTYGSVDGGEVHYDGEVFAAIVWRLMERYAAAGLSTDDLFRTYVDGMTFTPAGPGLGGHARGMLQSAAASGLPQETCLIWNAFADFGVGVGADGVINNSGKVTITESFTLPPGC